VARDIEAGKAGRQAGRQEEEEEEEQAKEEEERGTGKKAGRTSDEVGQGGCAASHINGGRLLGEEAWRRGREKIRRKGRRGGGSEGRQAGRRAGSPSMAYRCSVTCSKQSEDKARKREGQGAAEEGTDALHRKGDRPERLKRSTLSPRPGRNALSGAAIGAAWPTR